TKSPMDGLRLTILNDTGQDYLIQSATLHREDFTAPTSGYNVKLHNFAFKHFFLPQQGVRLWWKKRENPTETS
ncbi:hypothetical protein, partial [uncultured Kiloniella sp.]|uniref:hypothetical protein n=1 Tax=uncultured Kiloniella sp. TaxID=1133091 RepID=UPI00261D5519